MEQDSPSLFAQGRETLRRIFEIAVQRLRDRRITMEWDPAVIEVMLSQSAWRESLNPLRTLDGFWHSAVGNAIERLMARRQLQAGDTIRVGVTDTASGPALRFAVSPPEGQDGGGAPAAPPPATG